MRSGLSARRSSPASRAVLGIAAITLVLVGGFAGTRPLATLALLTSASTTGSSITSASIFPAVRTVAAWNVADSSKGTEAHKSDPLSFPADALTEKTGAFAVVFAAGRYLEWDYDDSVAGGLSASSVAFNFRAIPNAAAQIACWYIEVRRASTNALLGMHGSSLVPYACTTGTTYATVSVNLPEVTGTDIANDLRIRLFASETAAKPIKIDLATVTGSSPFGGFTLYEETESDASTGTPTITPWSLATVDADALTTAANWTTAFAPNRYLLFTFDPDVPAGSVITSAELTDVYRSSTSATSCVYFEVYSGATLIGTHGSALAPTSCATNAAWVTDTVTLPEVNTVARANGVQVRLYVKSSGSRKTLHDTVSLSLTYARP